MRFVRLKQKNHSWKHYSLGILITDMSWEAFLGIFIGISWNFSGTISNGYPSWSFMTKFRGFYQHGNIPPLAMGLWYCDLICVQASLMWIIGIWSMTKHPWWWLLWFDPCPSILDDDYWDFIHVQASLMIIVICSMSKHPWWCWLGFYQHPSILNDDYCDLIFVQAFLMMI